MMRREFLEKAGLAAGLPLMSGMLQAADGPAGSKRPEIQYRKFGRTDIDVSLIGLGGFHIGKPKDEADGIKIVRTAIDSGINFMDNSWDYHDGDSEVRMGKALKDGYREKVFLMTKVDGRTKKEAAKQIEQSLKRLQTDTIDLLQHHEIIRMEDPDRIFQEGGAQEAFLEAQKAGKIRFIGFTGHKDPLVHLRMLEVAAKHNFRFDSAQMPLNVMDAHFRSFAHLVVPKLVEEGIAVLAMKTLSDGHILKSKVVTPIECLHYAMHLPVSTVISGIDSLKILDQALEALKTYKPFTPDQLKELLAKTEKAAADGKYEPFKTGNGFDSTAQHPEWLGEVSAGPV